MCRVDFACVHSPLLPRCHAGYKERHAGRESTVPPSAAPSAAADSSLLQVPPPFYKRWFPHEFGRRERHLGLCYSYETLFSSAPPVREVQGFNFTQDPDSKHPKPGFATWTAGLCTAWCGTPESVTRSICD